ncbi:MAG: hypothetical protein RLW62_08700 [Gammaproteobacteria bacterium]
MSGADGAPPGGPRRLVLTLSGGRLPRALDMLLRLFGSDGLPELHAMFIEDSDLLKAASLPFAFEFCAATSARRPIDRARIEAHLRREAAAAERGLAELARTSGLRWQFEVVRERTRVVVTRALALTDAVVVTPREESPTPGTGGVTCIFADDDAGRRACAVAAALARAGHLPLEQWRLVDDATTDAAPSAATLTAAALPAMLRRPGAQLTVLPAALVETLDASVHDLAEFATAPLVIVR